MTVKNNQIEIPFTQADKDKLDSVEAGAQPQPAIATQAEAEAGLDNVKQMTPLRVLQSIQANAAGGGSSESGSFTNNSGFTIAALSLVTQNSSGNIHLVNPTLSFDVLNIIGVNPTSISNGSSGTVVFAGLIQNITTSFAIGDVIYLNSDGTLTNVTPDYGVGAFTAGYFVVKVGKITKDFSNPLNKDLLVKIEILGKL